jgi:hypothetical protein
MPVVDVWHGPHAAGCAERGTGMMRSMGTLARLPIGRLVVGWLIVATVVSFEFATGHGAWVTCIIVASAIGSALGRWQRARAKRAKSPQQHADPDVDTQA